MKILVVNNAKLKDKSFNDPLIEAVAGVSDYRTAHYRDMPSTQELRSFGAIVLSGVPKKYPVASIKDRQRRLPPVIRAGVPVLGICVIHQAIGLRSGAELEEEGKEAEEGLRSMTLAPGPTDPFFNDIPPTFKAMTMHDCSITLPRGFILQATNETCANQAMSDPSGLLRSTQFHPELSPDRDLFFANLAEIALRHRTAVAA